MPRSPRKRCAASHCVFPATYKVKLPRLGQFPAETIRVCAWHATCAWKNSMPDLKPDFKVYRFRKL